MLINAVYRLPIWYDIDIKSRNVRILIFGIILYIIVHSFIYSKYVENNELVLRYRNYLYYLIGADLVIIGLLMLTKKTNKEKNKKIKNLNKFRMPYNIYYPQHRLNVPIKNTISVKNKNEIIKKSEIQNLNENKVDEDINLPIYNSQKDQDPILNIIESEIPVYEPKKNLVETNIPIYNSNKNINPVILI